jgi:hypothetical protein
LGADSSEFCAGSGFSPAVTDGINCRDAIESKHTHRIVNVVYQVVAGSSPAVVNVIAVQPRSPGFLHVIGVAGACFFSLAGGGAGIHSFYFCLLTFSLPSPRVWSYLVAFCKQRTAENKEEEDGITTLPAAYKEKGRRKTDLSLSQQTLFPSSSSAGAALKYSTLLHRINTSPNAPVDLPSNGLQRQEGQQRGLARA